MRIEKFPIDNKKSDNAENLQREFKEWEKEHQQKKEENTSKKKSWKKLNKTRETKSKEPQPIPDKQLEKQGGEKKEESASLKIVNHFREEFKKLKDFPDQKEYQKYNKCNKALNLIKDWLPFGYLDNFQGVQNILSVMEHSKPKTALTFGHIQEKTAQQIAYEMAFQYKMWKMDNATKTKAIHNFIDKWLKEKSFYYQAGENWRDFWSTKPEEYLQYRAKNGYFFEGNIGEKAKGRFEPDKLQKSFGFSIGNLIKLAGGRDKTLSETCKILAAQGVNYEDLRPLMNSIENQFIKQRTDSQIMDIEELEDNKKLAIFLKEKRRIGTLPTKPLKIEYFKQLIEEQIADKKIPKKQVELLLNIIANNKEILKNKKAREVLKMFQTKIKDVSKKQTIKEQAELSPKGQRVIAQAKEFIKKQEKKKRSIWGTTGELMGWSAFLFFVLFAVAELKGIEELTGIKLEGGKKKK